MYVVCVTAFVKAEFVDSFIEASLENARHTREEAGNVRFDFLRAEADATQFFLYEVYRSKDDFTKHQQTEHYLRWKSTVADWMRQPRVGVRHTSIFFDNSEQ